MVRKIRDCQGLGESEGWVGWAQMFGGVSENTICRDMVELACNPSPWGLEGGGL